LLTKFKEVSIGGEKNMSKEIKEIFGVLLKDIHGLNEVLVRQEFKSTQEAYDAALYVLNSVNALIEEIADADENLDPEKTNLPDVDELFAEDPVTDYVQAAIMYAQSEGSADAEQALKEAALKVAESQKELAEVVCDYPNCGCYFGDEDGCHMEALEGDNLQDHIDYTEEEYANVVMTNMDLVERELEGKTEFSLTDLYLIRYYLKHLPSNSDYTVEAMSDGALVAAWKKLKYIGRVK
jgi:hypothetical protein